MKKLISVFAILSTMAAMPAGAQEGVTSFLDRPPTVEELRDALLPSTQLEASTRSIRLKSNKSVGNSTVSTAKPKAALAIQFQHSSAVLTNDAKQVLDVVVESINTTKLKYFTFRIEGHTDASGEDQYNLGLSKQRARSVKQYLVAAGGVNPETLKTEGFGERRLFNEGNPYDPKNRRVDIVNMGP